MALPLIPIAIGLGVAWWVSKNKQGAGAAPSGSTPQSFTDWRTNDLPGLTGGGNTVAWAPTANPGPVVYQPPPSTMYPTTGPTPKAADTGGTGLVSTQTGLAPVAVPTNIQTVTSLPAMPVPTNIQTVTSIPTIQPVSAPTIGGVATSYNTVTALSSSSQYLIDQMKQAQQQQYQTALASYQNFGFK